MKKKLTLAAAGLAAMAAPAPASAQDFEQWWDYGDPLVQIFIDMIGLGSGRGGSSEPPVPPSWWMDCSSPQFQAYRIAINYPCPPEQ